MPSYDASSVSIVLALYEND